ncbi:MAG: hypothetical protein JSS93_08445 [Bacteroidetes bacterium]|nr:hypothetical protein [Bacteroidota bacterium]
MKKTLSHILLESAFIVFSVFVGFALERYRENLADKERKIQLYKELSNDIENMLESDIERLNGRYRSLDRSFSYLINAIESGSNVLPDTFFVSLHDIEYFPILVAQRPTYNSIINSGTIIFFEQDSTFKKIQQLYERIDLLNLAVGDDSFYKTYLTPLLNKYSDRGALKYNYISNRVYASRKPQIDFNQFRTKEFLNILHLLKFRIELYKANELIINQSKEIIADIKNQK